MKKPKIITIGICTGCRFQINPCPYFQRRIKRHLRELWHAGHEAMEMRQVERVAGLMPQKDQMAEWMMRS